ncbi:saccharopine dehydrogenase family protein [Amycolatopsis anabasis]|uniref:saccharopine dehydrogenase family protein n=1 Tax=Amycolatopsis anabasis TaxID=1840409 RepID=UPI001C551088|nr:saccharopine dehydrogenase NADP-binding domain-containing protein [Amycolatopsis anabasis]
MNGDRILVFGGYGAVGRVTATALARWFPGRVVAAGRDPDRARAFAEETAGAVRPLAVDVTDRAAVERAVADAGVVVCCVERANEVLARICLERGVHYVDVSATRSVLESLEGLDELAATTGAVAALSVGVAPGLTNLLARRCVAELGSATGVDVTILLGLGEHHGQDAVRWTVDSLAQPAARGLARKRVHLPGAGRRTAFPFPFSDQHTLSRTLGAPVTTRLCFDSAPATWAMFGLRRIGFFAAAHRLRLDGLLTAALSSVHFGRVSFVVHAAAVDERGRRAAFAASGSRESEATGIVTAHVARLLHAGGLAPGVHHLEQLVEPAALFRDLEPDGIRFHTADPR